MKTIEPGIVEKMIYLIQGQKVMVDTELADLYEVETKALNRAMRRNIGRFPDDFMFQLTESEFEALRCQIGTLKTGREAHRKYLYHSIRSRTKVQTDALTRFSRNAPREECFERNSQALNFEAQ